MKTMRKETRENKDDLLRKLKEREARWEREKKDMVKRLTTLKSKIEVMQRKNRENAAEDRQECNREVGN